MSLVSSPDGRRPRLRFGPGSARAPLSCVRQGLAACRRLRGGSSNGPPGVRGPFRTEADPGPGPHGDRDTPGPRTSLTAPQAAGSVPSPSAGGRGGPPDDRRPTAVVPPPIAIGRVESPVVRPGDGLRPRGLAAGRVGRRAAGERDRSGETAGGPDAARGYEEAFHREYRRSTRAPPGARRRLTGPIARRHGASGYGAQGDRSSGRAAPGLTAAGPPTWPDRERRGGRRGVRPIRTRCDRSGPGTDRSRPANPVALGISAFGAARAAAGDGRTATGASGRARHQGGESRSPGREPFTVHATGPDRNTRTC